MIVKILTNCPDCQGRGTALPVGWLPESGLNPLLRAFQCKDCQARFYLEVRSTNRRLAIDEQVNRIASAEALMDTI